MSTFLDVHSDNGFPFIMCMYWNCLVLISHNKTTREDLLWSTKKPLIMWSQLFIILKERLHIRLYINIRERFCYTIQQVSKIIFHH